MFHNDHTIIQIFNLRFLCKCKYKCKYVENNWFLITFYFSDGNLLKQWGVSRHIKAQFWPPSDPKECSVICCIEKCTWFFFSKSIFFSRLSPVPQDGLIEDVKENETQIQISEYKLKQVWWSRSIREALGASRVQIRIHDPDTPQHSFFKVRSNPYWNLS